MPTNQAPSDDARELSALPSTGAVQWRAVARKWFEGQVSYEVVVRSGRPAATVLKAEEDLAVDLVVMATHGRTGREHVRLGSVTEEVVRRSTRPS